MDKRIIILIGIGGLIITLYFINKLMKVKNFNLRSEKIASNTSLVLVVKNNEKLLKHAITKVLWDRKEIGEILVMDLGSIDGTIKLVHKLMEKDSRIRIITIIHKLITENYFSIIRGQTSGEAVLVLDLYKLSEENPSVYVPELFKTLEHVLEKDFPKVDERIDGDRLLYFHQQEREKNSYILKDYIISPLCNIQGGIEKLMKYTKETEGISVDNIKEINKYVENTIKDLKILLQLMTPSEFKGNSLEEDMISLFKTYGEKHRVSINYKRIDSEKKLSAPISSLILELIQDLLYTVVYYNLSSDINILERYGRKTYTILFKYQCICDERTLLSKNNGLSYYVLHSIQNRLSLVGGTMRIRVKPKWKVNILIQLPQ